MSYHAPMLYKLEYSMSDKDRTVFQRPDKVWVNKLNGASKASSLHPTQAEANEAAKQMLSNAGGGEMTTMGRSGRIVSKDTIGSGNDPCSIKDKEH